MLKRIAKALGLNPVTPTAPKTSELKLSCMSLGKFLQDSGIPPTSVSLYSDGYAGMFKTPEVIDKWLIEDARLQPRDDKIQKLIIDWKPAGEYQHIPIGNFEIVRAGFSPGLGKFVLDVFNKDSADWVITTRTLEEFAKLVSQ